MTNSSNSNRRVLLVDAALAAGITGAGVAWWREQRQASERDSPSNAGDAQMLAAFWSLEFATPSGKNLALSSLKGKPLLINFWATWCPPCVEELPLIDSFYQANLKNGWHC